ncbi:protein HYPER-SENSITIVITY-RELATED 4-like [Salvia miltiorrhiza]|uniref:protein HYPER-SENSITIVITY-RELATED 4-like n=1 Tax=Salvia miltiorrhiza TaxID=226208 RepID=UPI0025AD6470|nr:protein HYPER-SENSITIVITY-RELATED 4-like [Salvia miltiorrhiza]
MNSTLGSEVRSFELTFHKTNREMVIHSYLPHIANLAKMRKQENKTIKIFTVDYENMYNINDMWKPVMLDHPATFATLAMDAHQKDVILKDVDRFLQRIEYYRKVGKAWKRGYLLYGLPGTGKSSFIAAMTNYLNFDVYDLELTELRQNSDLQKLLLATANKSVLVVEDIDCTIWTPACCCLPLFSTLRRLPPPSLYPLAALPPSHLCPLASRRLCRLPTDLRRLRRPPTSIHPAPLPSFPLCKSASPFPALFRRHRLRLSPLASSPPPPPSRIQRSSRLSPLRLRPLASTVRAASALSPLILLVV